MSGRFRGLRAITRWSWCTAVPIHSWPTSLTTPQKGRLKELLRYNLKSVRAYLLKEDFQQFWEYASPVRRLSN